jgi:hypothetical protein
MSPIKDVSDIRRMPRLGKIRLGIKVQGDKNPYPQATDYFVVPPTITEYVGQKPRTLTIMFPSDNPEDFAPQYLKCYSYSQKLVCKGNGVTCRRKVDTLTGDFASHTTDEWVFQDELPCDPDECPKYQAKQCRRVMNLMFIMPSVPGLGLWQLDTTSIYSIININSSVDLIKQVCGGRIRMIPLTLSLEPQEVEPLGEKRKIVHILHLRSDIKLSDTQRLLRKKPEEVLLPEIDEEEVPSDLFLPEGERPPAEPAAPQSAAEPPPADADWEKLESAGSGGLPPGAAKSRDPNTVKQEDIPDYNALARVCYECWGMQPPAVAKELGYAFFREISLPPWDAFLTIKASKEGPPDETD